VSADLAEAYLKLSLVSGMGPVSAERLLEGVQYPQDIFNLSMSQLCMVDGIGPERARKIMNPGLSEQAEAERAHAASTGLRIITRADADYPKDLLRLSDPPLALWIKGELQPRDRLAVAVVGPRTPSSYGHRQARRLVTGLSQMGCCVVSGLARGVDTVAHEAALAQYEGRTVAVLGSGFDHPYPQENHDLLQRIVDGHGAVISEFPCATRPSPGTFPRRNRIVAALSLAVLVVEAGARSGSLITARLAMELGKEVLALPGPIDRAEHTGSNRLLRDGATLITSLDDIISEIPALTILTQHQSDEVEAHDAAAPQTPLTGRERDLYTLLSDDVRSVDDLVRISRFPASSVSATLISLELKRLARRQAGGYVRAL
jgi:DNA processing protein